MSAAKCLTLNKSATVGRRRAFTFSLQEFSAVYHRELLNYYYFFTLKWLSMLRLC